MDIDMFTVSKVVGALAIGSLHWVNYEGTIILAFHLADEKISKLQPPAPGLTPADVPNVVITLGVLGDFLSATYYYMGGVTDIWLLKKNKDNNGLGWSKEFNFCCNNISCPFGYTKSGRLLYHANGEICSYSAKDSSAEMDVSFGKFVSETIPHKNTFVSLKVLGEEDTKTMGSGKRACSSEEAEHNNKLKMPWSEVRDL
ncbi:uncharacterized protein LOC113293808 [Papaver somniferum]|uniref:uncharacterized protein LOC113293808 n=1 Tax=Papaver somniferum TaxID=3469 RepID=UPI000E7053AA|nr:uncharacterized protein LOC113293808 [Papaver somniferum]